MAIKVSVQWRDPGTEPSEIHGENVTVEGAVMKVWTEPHEIKPGGLVDLFVGDIIPLDAFDVASVRRV